MKLQITKGSTSVLAEVFIRDSTKTDGSGLTGLLFNSAGLTAYYYRSGAASATSITLQTMTVGTWASGGFKEIDSTNMPGWYQIGLPDAALASGANKVEFHLKGATNMAPLPFEIQLQNLDPYDGVRGGLTALPNAAAGSTGGLDCTVSFGGTASAGSATSITLASGSAVDNYYNHQIVQITGGTGAGQARVIIAYNGTTKVATVSRTWATNPDSTSVFQVKPPEVSPTTQLLGGTLSAATSTTATLTGGVATDSYYNGALLVITAGTGQRQARVITGYVGSTTVATVEYAWATTPDSTSVFVVYGDSLAALNSSLQVTAASVQGNVTGSVGSVTGNVGGSVASVTGNVGGNVTGSVGSVTNPVTVGTNNDKTGYSLTSLESLNLHSGTAQTGSTGTTIKLASGAEATNDNLYRGCVVKIYGGTGASQARVITAYVAATRVATVDRAWIVTPDNTSTYAVLALDLPASDTSLQVAANAVNGNVTGSVGSVTGNVGGSVGSVTGNVGGSVGSVVGAVGSVTAAVSLSAADSPAINSGTATAGSTNTITLPGGASAVDQLYRGETIKITGGTGAGQTRAILDYTSKVVTVDRNWTTTPDSTSVYAVLATNTPRIDTGLAVTVGTNNDKTGYSLSGTDSSISNSGTAQAGSSANITLAAGASATDSLYVGEVVRITSGTGAGQARVITAYNGTTKVATVDRAWITAPNSSSVYSVVSTSSPQIDTSLQVTVGTNNDKTGYGISAAAVQSIWDALTSALTTVGSIGKLLVTNLDAAISSRSSLDAPTVKSQVVAALSTDTYAEPSGAPAATASLVAKISWMCAHALNKGTFNRSTGIKILRNNADSANIATGTDSDDGTTYTAGKWS